MTTSSAQVLYAHIHRLLDEHIAVHLATDYIDCTQSLVFQALTGGLLPVSEDDPHFLVLPSDPLDDLTKEQCQIEMKDTCERLPAVKKAQELIWCTIDTKAMERTFASRFNDTFCGYSRSTDLFADPSVLSVHSICHTPKLGCSKSPHFVPLNLGEVLSLNLVELASVEEDKDTDTQTDALRCRLTMDHHSWKEILLSYKASPFSTTHTSGTEFAESTESRVCNKFLSRTPSPSLLAFLPQTPPLFSRKYLGKNITSKQPSYFPPSMSGLQLVAPSTSSDGFEGMLEYVDDEWAVSSTLSPSSPCLNNSPSKQDECFMLSSESQGQTDDLFGSKMDMFYMPRQSRVGGFREVFRVPGQGQQLHEYIGSAVWLTEGQNITTPTPTYNTIVTPLTSVHRVDAFPTPDNMCQSSDDAFLGQLVTDFADEAIDAVFLDQSTDTRSGLMNVPKLPAPNVHTHDTVWPNDMKSLFISKAFAPLDVIKGIKSLNLELAWRPYDTEQAIPTVEELVGVSDVHYSVDGEEAKSQLAELLKWLNSLIQPIVVEEECRGKFQAFLKFTNVDFVTVIPDPLDCELSNVLPTRAERLSSRLLPRSQLKRTYSRAGQWDEDDCSAQSQSLGQSKADSPSEDNNYGQSTEPESVHSGALVHGRTLLSDLSEGVAFDAENDITSAPHVHLFAESIISLSPAGLSLNSDPISNLGSSKSLNPDWIHPSKSGGLESNHQSTSFELATCEEQSLQGFLKIFAKHPPSGQAVNDMHLSSPTCSEPRGFSPSPVDTEGLLRELSKLAAPLPPSASSHCNHRYLASVELLQDRPLTRALCLDSLRMELVEREWVDGADIVFDCDTALVFVPLFQVSLPSGFGALKDRLSSLSWQYTHLAVVFKLYEAGISGRQPPRDEGERTDLFSRVIRAIKKLQRGLALAEVYAIKRPQTVIQMYFVRSVEQAATTARLLGDVAESRSQFGPWGDRLWLGVDEIEEERYLAGVDGMNAFAAAVILSQISLHDFLALQADQRLQLVLPIPENMMERFNEVIAQRREDVDTFVEDEDGGY